MSGLNLNDMRNIFVLKRKNKKNLGFTLIELLVVISVIGFLASASIVALDNARMKARDDRRMSDIKQFQKAMDLYYDTNNIYPASGWLFSYSADWMNNTNTLAVALKPHISTLPVDPKNEAAPPYYGAGYSYAYYASSYGGTGQWYMIVFMLEQKNHFFQTQDGVKLVMARFFIMVRAVTALLPLAETALQNN